MAKFVCTVCGYVHEGDAAPEFCPQCKAPASKFVKQEGSTKKNLEMRVEAENGATAGKTALAKKAKELGLDAIHDTVHEMARDEARHGKAFAGLLARYFG